MKADLHCHTKISDGSMGIEEVIANAKAMGLDCLAITDHDTIASFARSKIIASRYDIQLIPAVEMSCFDYERNQKVHILCYLPEKPDRLLGICNQVIKERQKVNEQIAEKVVKRFAISITHIKKYASGSSCLYKQHIMHALFEAGYTTTIYGELYNDLFKKSKYGCNLKVSYPDVHETLQVIHEANGLAVLAHPRVYDSFELLDDLIKENALDGIEVWHTRNQEGDSEYLLNKALQYELIPTGGSDFHGMYSSCAAPIGKYTTPEKYLKMLTKHYKKTSKAV